MKTLDEEIFETLRKEEIIMYLNKRLRKIGRNLLLIDEQKAKESKDVKDLPFNPKNIKKYKPHFQETLR